MPSSAESRRRFIASFAGLGLGSTLMPGVVWAQMEEQKSPRVTLSMLKEAAALSGLEFTDAECEAMLDRVNDSLPRLNTLHAFHIPDEVAPPFYFSALVPGMHVDRAERPFKPSSPPKLKRPANLEEVAFWPVSHLAHLIRTRSVSSVELTTMYLGRLHKYNEKLNCVVTFLDDVAMAQAREADKEIAAGNDRGPLHGIPWGAKDIIAVNGFPTTWGSGAFREQMIDEDATVVRLLREAGAVLLAKLTTGELAGGDRWFGGRTNNPWNLEEGSSGSSAGPGSATAAGLVGFSIGTETGGSILSPSARCGVTGLRPTFGRVSRFGAMTLSWTQDRLGPMCRSVEDCALVMRAIARPDGRDLSVAEIPFNWDAGLDVSKLRIGYLADAIADTTQRKPEWIRNERSTLAKLKGMGVTLVPISVPDFPTDLLSLSVESSVSFDQFLRSGRDELLTNRDRGHRMRAGRFISAVDYLQSQRARSMMMQALAKATEGVDVYLAPSTGGTIRAEPAAGAAPAPQPQNLAQKHFSMANLACYPGLALPNGFAESGSPTSITFMARPFGEAALLAVAKAYQDATDFHLKQPRL